MSQINNVNFPENKFILLFLYSTEKNGSQKQHSMTERSISNEKDFGFEKKVYQIQIAFVKITYIMR